MRKSREQRGSASVEKAALGFFPTAFGLFLGVALLKFGNPPIMEKYVAPPQDITEFILGSPWPISWAYVGLACLAVWGALAAASAAGIGEKWRSIPLWLRIAPILWIGWVVFSASGSAAPDLTPGMVAHLVACTACFFLGLLVLASIDNLEGFWVGLLAGFLFVIIAGWSQEFGGLERTRKYFYAYIYPELKVVPPEYLKKVASNRIFSTLFYPNSLAGALLVLLPPLTAFLFLWERRFTLAARSFLAGCIGLGGLACLYWSGSKGGWLLMLGMAGAFLFFVPVPKRLKLSVLALVLVVGVSGFIYKYADFFKRGATSVNARFDYWRAGVLIAKDHPVLGAGPGAFGPLYARAKDPRSEPARLAHNDYLEQASDSGLPAAVAYLLFIWGGLLWAFPSRNPANPPSPTPRPPLDWLSLAAWLGVLAWGCQGLFEFSLYIPGVSWPSFAILGLLVGAKANRHRDLRLLKPAS